jgi:hypothetical protein
MGEKIMTMHTGDKLCQWCRKMFPKKDVRFYPKADMKMCSNCVEAWEGKKFIQKMFPSPLKTYSEKPMVS